MASICRAVNLNRVFGGQSTVGGWLARLIVKQIRMKIEVVKSLSQVADAAHDAEGTRMI